MIKLGSWIAEGNTPQEVAKRAYHNEGVRATGWKGYIMVKPQRIPTGAVGFERDVLTAYFRTTKNKQHYPEYSTEIL